MSGKAEQAGQLPEMFKLMQDVRAAQLEAQSHADELELIEAVEEARAGLALLEGMLTLDPERRITAEAALKHAYFREAPEPKPHELMPTHRSSHDGQRHPQRERSVDAAQEEARFRMASER